MRKLAMTVAIGVLLIVVVTSILPMVGSMVGTLTDTALTVVLNIAPKVALLSAAIGLLLLCTHWTRTHGIKWIVGAFFCAVGFGALAVMAAWVGPESNTVAAAGTNLAGAIIQKIADGLHAGIG